MTPDGGGGICRGGGSSSYLNPVCAKPSYVIRLSMHSLITIRLNRAISHTKILLYLQKFIIPSRKYQLIHKSLLNIDGLSCDL